MTTNISPSTAAALALAGSLAGSSAFGLMVLGLLTFSAMHTAVGVLLLLVAITAAKLIWKAAGPKPL